MPPAGAAAAGAVVGAAGFGAVVAAAGAGAVVAAAGAVVGALAAGAVVAAGAAGAVVAAGAAAGALHACARSARTMTSTLGRFFMHSLPSVLCTLCCQLEVAARLTAPSGQRGRPLRARTPPPQYVRQPGRGRATAPRTTSVRSGRLPPRSGPPPRHPTDGGQHRQRCHP